MKVQTMKRKRKWNKARVQTGSWRLCREPCTTKRWSLPEIWRWRRRSPTSIRAGRGPDGPWRHSMTSFPVDLNSMQPYQRTDSQRTSGFKHRSVNY